jgi:hypothetical protein
MSKERYQTRLDPDDADAVEEYQEEHDLTESEAVRQLVQEGIQATGEPVEATVADGGEVADRLDGFEEQQRRAADHAKSFQTAANVAGGLFIAAWAIGLVSGLLALGLAVVVLVIEASALAYNLGVGSGA